MKIFSFCVFSSSFCHPPLFCKPHLGKSSPFFEWASIAKFSSTSAYVFPKCPPIPRPPMVLPERRGPRHPTSVARGRRARSATGANGGSRCVAANLSDPWFSLKGYTVSVQKHLLQKETKGPFSSSTPVISPPSSLFGGRCSTHPRSIGCFTTALFSRTISYLCNEDYKSVHFRLREKFIPNFLNPHPHWKTRVLAIFASLVQLKF